MEAGPPAWQSTQWRHTGAGGVEGLSICSMQAQLVLATGSQERSTQLPGCRAQLEVRECVHGVRLSFRSGPLQKKAPFSARELLLPELQNVPISAMYKT